MKVIYLPLLALVVNACVMAGGANRAGSEDVAKDSQACGARADDLNLTRDPDSLLTELAHSGAKAVVRRLSCGAGSLWDAVLQKIESGDPRWLNVAAQLAAGTDAATSEALLVTLARALVKNPVGVLRLAGSQTFLSIEDLCGAPFIEPEPAYLRHYLNAAEHAVERLEERAIEEPRSKCLAQIKRIIAEENARSSAPR